MDEVFFLSLSTISIDNRGGGWDGRQGGVGGGKNYPLGHSMSSHDTHTVANEHQWAT